MKSSLIGFGSIAVLFFSCMTPVEGFREAAEGHISAMSEKYDVVAWRERAKRANYARLASIGKDIDISIIPNAKVLSTEDIARGYGGLPTRWHLLSPQHRVEEGEFYLSLRFSQGASIQDAHKAMLDFFTTCAAIQPFPKGQSKGVDVGDACFLGWGEEIASLTFVRNNVFVYVSQTKEPPYRAVEIAKLLDQAILKASSHQVTGYLPELAQEERGQIEAIKEGLEDPIAKLMSGNNRIRDEGTDELLRQREAEISRLLQIVEDPALRAKDRRAVVSAIELLGDKKIIGPAP